MVEVVLVSLAVSCLHYVERSQFGEDEIEQSAPLQVHKTTARRARHHYLVEFVLDAFAAHNLYPVGVAHQCVERFVLYHEVQLRGKPYAAHHSQRVVREGYVWVERRSYYAVLKVVCTVEGIHEFAEPVFVQTHGHGVDGEVAAVLVVLQSSVLYHRFARVVTVALLACAHELHLHAARQFHLRRAEVAEHSEPSLASESLLQFVGHAYSAANHHHVDVV